MTFQRQNPFINMMQSRANSLNIELLKGDIDYILKCLPKIPYDRRHAVIDDYLKIWQKTANECESPIAAQNIGRRCANQWLRGICIGYNG